MVKKRRYEKIDHDPETEAMLREAIRILREGKEWR